MFWTLKTSEWVRWSHPNSMSASRKRKQNPTKQLTLLLNMHTWNQPGPLTGDWFGPVGYTLDTCTDTDTFAMVLPWRFLIIFACSTRGIKRTKTNSIWCLNHERKASLVSGHLFQQIEPGILLSWLPIGYPNMFWTLHPDSKMKTSEQHVRT